MRVTSLLAVALIAVALLSADLGRAPFVDPPEGIHAEIARGMLRSGDWITPHLDGIPYFDKPPLLYWLLAASFAVFGCSEWSARLWSTLPAIAVAVLTARIGILLGSVRVGLIAGLVWEREDPAEAWRGDRRVFLLSVVRAERSVINDLPPAPVYLLLDAGGRRLYSNRP